LKNTIVHSCCDHRRNWNAAIERSVRTLVVHVIVTFILTTFFTTVWSQIKGDTFEENEDVNKMNRKTM
jgi:hypothetical protein